MTKKEVTDGTWVYSTFYKQANLIKTVDGALVTFRYPFKSGGSEIFHTTVTGVCSPGAYRLASNDEIEAFSKKITAPKFLKYQSNNFKPGDFFVHIARGEVNQIQTIGEVSPSGNATVTLRYRFKDGPKTGTLSTFNDPNVCRPASEMEIIAFIQLLNPELHKPVYRGTEGEWVIVNVDGYHDTNMIYRYYGSNKNNVSFFFKAYSAPNKIDTVINFTVNDIVGPAEDTDIAQKIKQLCIDTPKEIGLVIRKGCTVDALLA